MSVIVGRALPDVRDGLKPVHRRILFAMEHLSNYYNRPYKKSARIVGDVIGKYHPHGDTAVYDALVRMAQDFSLRYLLVDGQGNFGSMDGDSPAAMRYTEVRFHRHAQLLMEDLDKNTVDFQPNYDESESIPIFLPARVPNILINGSDGIAVGMATKIPPHNLGEICNATLALLDNPDIGVRELMEHIPGPDFPTGGIINGISGIVKAYETGRGSILLRAVADIEQNGNREAIIVSEMPYQVNKARMIERIAQSVRDKRIHGISEIRDESDKDGVRVVIEVRRSEQAEVVLNNLYKHSQLEESYGINMVALDHGRPRTMNLKQILEAFLNHRREVVSRRTEYELRRARERGHNLEGLAVALANIDPIIETIRASSDRADAIARLLSKPWALADLTAMLERAGADACRPKGDEYVGGVTRSTHEDDVDFIEEPVPGSGYRLSPQQARAITEMRLHQLTSLEREKLRTNYSEILDQIIIYQGILADSSRLQEVIREETLEVIEKFADERRTQIQQDQLDLTRADLVAPEDRVVTISYGGYIKAQAVSDYRAQRRGGIGRSASGLKSEDAIAHMAVAHTHKDHVLFFSTAGKVYRQPTLEIPTAGFTSSGRPLVRVIQALEKNREERIAAMLPMSTEPSADTYLVMATSKGQVVKIPLHKFASINRNGKIAVRLREDDSLVTAMLATDEDEFLLLTSIGKAIRFRGSQVRTTGRGAMGVRGIRLSGGAVVVGMLAVPKEDEQREVLFLTEKGYGKRTPFADFPLKKNRGGMGVIGIRDTARNGPLVAVLAASSLEDVMLISDGGTLVRVPVDQIRSMGRSTKGVGVAKLRDSQQLVGAVLTEKYIEEAEDTEEGTPAGEGRVAEPSAIQESPDAEPHSEEGDKETDD